MRSLFCTVQSRIHMAIQMFYDNHFPSFNVLACFSFTSWTSFCYLLPIRTASGKDSQNHYWNCSLKVIDGVQSTCCFVEMCSSGVFLASHWLWDAMLATAACDNISTTACTKSNHQCGIRNENQLRKWYLVVGKCSANNEAQVQAERRTLFLRELAERRCKLPLLKTGISLRNGSHVLV